MSYSSGEAAEQVVRMTLNGVEVAAKISGKAAERLAVLLYAVLQDQKKTRGIDALPTIIRSIVTGLWNALPVLLDGVVQMVSSIGSYIWTMLTGYGERLGNFFSGIWNGIKNIFGNVGNFFKNIFKGAFDGIKSVFGGIADWFKNIFNKISDVIKAPINFVIKGLNKLIDGLNKIGFDIPDWVPVIGGKRFGFNIGKIALLANGGVVDKPTPSIIGEDGEEAVVPLEKNTGWMRKVAVQLHELTLKEDRSKDVSKNIPSDGGLMSMLKVEVGNRIKNLEDAVISILETLKQFFPELIEAFDVTMVMDDGTLVARLTPKIDRELGLIQKRKERG